MGKNVTVTNIMNVCVGIVHINILQAGHRAQSTKVLGSTVEDFYMYC